MKALSFSFSLLVALGATVGLTHSKAFGAALAPALESPTCPTATKRIFDCKSTPQKGDSEDAAGALDAIQVCRGVGVASLIMEKAGSPAETDKADATQRADGVTYTIDNDEIAYSIALRLSKLKKADATFTINLKEAKQTLSSHYTCDEL